MNNSLTLFEVAEEFREAAAKLRDSDLDDQTIADTLEGMQYPVEVKMRNVAFVIENMEAEADAIATAMGALADRNIRLRHRILRLENYLLTNMQSCGISKIESPLLTIALRNNPPKVVIDDEKALPWEYMKQPPQPPPAPEKTLIREALKAGKEVPGAHLEQTQRLNIKV